MSQGQGSYFTYNNIDSRELSLIMAVVDGNSEDEVKVAGAIKEVVMDSPMNSIKSVFYGVKREPNYEFDVEIYTINNNANIEVTRDDLNIFRNKFVIDWLNGQSSPKELRLQKIGFDNVSLRGFFKDVTRVFDNDKMWGAKGTFVSVDMYPMSNDNVRTFTNTQLTKDIEFYIDSSHSKVDTIVEIQLASNETGIRLDSIDNSDIALIVSGLPSGSKIIYDSNRGTVKAYKGNTLITNIWSYVDNSKDFCLIAGMNKIKITGRCDLTFKYSYPINIL